MNDKKPPADASSPDRSAGEDESTRTGAPIRALRVWPAILMVILMWGLRVGGGFVSGSESVDTPLAGFARSVDTSLAGFGG